MAETYRRVGHLDIGSSSSLDLHIAQGYLMRHIDVDNQCTPGRGECDVGRSGCNPAESRQSEISRKAIKRGA